MTRGNMVSSYTAAAHTRGNIGTYQELRLLYSRANLLGSSYHYQYFGVEEH